MVVKSVENGFICWFTEIKTFQESIVMEVKVCHSSKRIYKLRISVNGLMEKNKDDGDD